MLNYKQKDTINPKKYSGVFLATLLNKITKHLHFVGYICPHQVVWIVRTQYVRQITDLTLILLFIKNIKQDIFMSIV